MRVCGPFAVVEIRPAQDPERGGWSCIHLVRSNLNLLKRHPLTEIEYKMAAQAIGRVLRFPEHHRSFDLCYTRSAMITGLIFPRRLFYRIPQDCEAIAQVIVPVGTVIPSPLSL